MALSEATKKLLVLFFLFEFYLILGMLLFVAVEGDVDSDNEWSYAQGFGFVVQVVTTIGYGNRTPVTTAGRILCMFYALFGIPIAVLFLQAVGEEILKLQHKLLKRGGAEPSYLNEKCVAVSLLAMIIVIFIGAGILMEVEGWSFMDGVYCYFITFTTIGFGDLIPTGKTIRILYPLYTILGLVVMSNLLNGLVGCSQDIAALKKFCCCGRKDARTNVETDVKNPDDGV